MRETTSDTIIAACIIILVAVTLLVGPCALVFAQELPTIAAADAIYDIYRIPKPVPLPAGITRVLRAPAAPEPGPLPSVAIYIDDNGHMVAKDEKGVMVDFDALGLNCDIMARDFEAMALMLRKIGDVGRKGAEESR